MADELNPYEPPRSIVADQSRSPKTRWHLVPALILMLLGGLGISQGVVAAIITIADDAGKSFVVMAFTSCVNLGVGMAWLLSGDAFRRRYFRQAWIELGIGLAIIVVAIAVFALTYKGKV